MMPTQPSLTFERPPVPVIEHGTKALYCVYVDGRLRCYIRATSAREALHVARITFPDPAIAVYHGDDKP